MKKIVASVLLSSLLAGSAFAATVDAMNPYDANFAKMNQYFNSLIESHLSAAALNNFSYPRTDIQDTKEKIILKFDLAGVKKENIKLSIDNNKVLTLEGEKKEYKEQKAKDFVKKEIFSGSFKKMIQLPENIDENKLETEFKDGILTVTIPKIEIKKPKAKIIPIK